MIHQTVRNMAILDIKRNWEHHEKCRSSFSERTMVRGSQQQFRVHNLSFPLRNKYLTCHFQCYFW